MKLKICGMKNFDNILEIAQLLPDYLGFIFWEKSARFFDETIPKIPKSILKVGVFVDSNFDEISSKIEKYKLDLIQLHGNESPEFCKKLYDSNIKIIKAFSINEDFDFEILKEFELVCDSFLFDTKGKLPGGNGTTFDWKLLEKFNIDKPFFLSGGIGLEEITQIKSFQKTKMAQNCIAIDINSKFESQPGIKKIKELSEFKNLLYENEF
ncbi:phosphoribosylanthranilate isomerase [Flavobacterium sp. SUN052]|uniref:phosphoribosylanthranilate isomerase n=1 Tax=Flavobacterium sp. SUN052 TaxID=3002441 RepID=UPI00237DA896|nr:phosphoribosylanthranilate isomerase [Flavobacterium sp. SUN052]MEC4004930.1 phosphoribosylanthranilate isomerase [Flavobacterium sp. SUN052]